MAVGRSVARLVVVVVVQFTWRQGGSWCGRFKRGSVFYGGRELCGPVHGGREVQAQSMAGAVHGGWGGAVHGGREVRGAGGSSVVQSMAVEKRFKSSRAMRLN